MAANDLTDVTAVAVEHFADRLGTSLATRSIKAAKSSSMFVHA